MCIRDRVYCGKLAYGRRKNEKVSGTRNEYRIVKQENYMLHDGIHEAVSYTHLDVYKRQGVWRFKNTEEIKEVSNENKEKDNHRGNSGLFSGSHGGLYLSVYRG